MGGGIEMAFDSFTAVKSDSFTPVNVSGNICRGGAPIILIDAYAFPSTGCEGCGCEGCCGGGCFSGVSPSFIFFSFGSKKEYIE